MPDASLAGELRLSHAAARSYADAVQLTIEEASVGLLGLLRLAHRVTPDADNGCERWRYRSRRDGVDIEAHVGREDGVTVVVHVRARRERSSAESNQRRRARD